MLTRYCCIRLEENTLCAWDFAFTADYRCASHSNSNSKSLEGTLGLVVVVVTSDNIDVHGNAGALGETLQTVGQHLGAEVANLLATQLQVADAERTVGQVDNCTGEGFVERSVCVTETGETGGRLEGGLVCLAFCEYMYSLAFSSIQRTWPIAMKTSSAVWWSSM